jgi:ABC-type dipeptide/oligopeptide/nickel transport system permease subunit
MSTAGSTAVPGAVAGASSRRRRADVLVPAAVLVLLALLATFPGAFTTGDPERCVLSRSMEGPSLAHPFGFSVFGCDYLTDTVHATRTSLGVAALTVLGTVAVAVVLGSLAGFLRGWVDVVVTGVTDVWSALPLLLGGIVVLSALQVRGVLSVSLVLVLFGWPAMVRLQRASVLQAAARDHVLAARALGASPARVLLRHVLPGAMRPLLGYASAYAGFVIGIEATLTYVGVGLQQPTLSWGLQLLQAQSRLSQAPHLLLPAGVLLLTVGSLVLLGSALQRREAERAH